MSKRIRSLRIRAAKGDQAAAAEVARLLAGEPEKIEDDTDAMDDEAMDEEVEDEEVEDEDAQEDDYASDEEEAEDEDAEDEEGEDEEIEDEKPAARTRKGKGGARARSASATPKRRRATATREPRMASIDQLLDLKASQGLEQVAGALAGQVTLAVAATVLKRTANAVRLAGIGDHPVAPGAGRRGAQGAGARLLGELEKRHAH